MGLDLAAVVEFLAVEEVDLEVDLEVRAYQAAISGILDQDQVPQKRNARLIAPARTSRKVQQIHFRLCRAQPQLSVRVR